MAKLTLQNVSSGYNASTIINSNFDAIKTAIENTLSRDGTTPNEMDANLDMDSNEILNLGAPTSPNSAARLVDVTDALDVSAAPSASGNANKVLVSNGTSTPAWQQIVDANVDSSAAIQNTKIKYNIIPAETAASVTPVNFYIPSHDAIGRVQLLRYGNNTVPGTTDMSTALQNAVNVAGAGGRVYIPAGTYYFGSTITLLEGIIIEGESQKSVDMLWAAGVTAFDYNPTPFSELRGFHLWDMTIESDLCIQVNRTSTTVANGVAPCFVVGGSVKRCRLYNVTTNTGYGVVGSCLFDWVFEENKFAGTFDIAMVLHASDINTVKNNRFTGFRSYGIVDRSAANFFGSSNAIHHNDFTLQSNTNAVFILTSSLYVNIKDNYFEQIGSGTGVAVEVTTRSPAGVNFGTNTNSNSSVIWIENNRVEPENNFAYAFKIDPSDAVTIVCKNNSSVANLGSSIFTTTNNDIPLIFNGNNLGSPEVEILGASWGVWDGFKSSGKAKSIGSGFTIDGTCNKCFPNLSATGSANFYGGGLVVIPAALSAGQLVRFCPNQAANQHFKDGATISVTVVARTRSASGDTLRIGFNSSLFDSAQTSFTLTDQFQKFTTFSFTAPAKTATDATLSFDRTTANGDIEIASVSWNN